MESDSAMVRGGNSSSTAMKTFLALAIIVAGVATVVFAKPLLVTGGTVRAEAVPVVAADPAAVAGPAVEAPAAPRPEPLVAHEVGRIAAAFVVHVDNPVAVLTLAQIRAILSGEIRSWSEVGGRDLPIVVVSEASGSATRRLVEDALLGEDGLAPASLEVVRDSERVATLVAGRPEAIGIVPPVSARDGVRRLATDAALEQPVVMVTRGAPTPAYARIIETVTRVASR